MALNLHPADLSDIEKIGTATHFNVHLRIGPAEKIDRKAKTLVSAIRIADRLGTTPGGRRPMIYAVTPDKKTVHVPAAMIDQARQEIEAAAKRRLADEYDAAQDRGEVRGRPGPITSGQEVIATVADIGLTHKDIHEARQIRAVIAANPAAVREALDDILAKGDEPTRGVGARYRTGDYRYPRRPDRHQEGPSHRDRRQCRKGHPAAATGFQRRDP